jgi:hypothetical protein
LEVAPDIELRVAKIKGKGCRDPSLQSVRHLFRLVLEQPRTGQPSLLSKPFDIN